MAGTRKGPRWTATELSTLRELAPTRTAAQIADELPGRTVAAVYQKLRHVGPRCAPWTPGEDLTLEALWGTDLEELAAKLGRTRRAVYERGNTLGLGVGRPVGFEYLTHAANRCGFAVSQLREILTWGRVRLRRSLAVERSGRPRYWVNPDAVDAAVARWMGRDEREAA